jgi:hypothetical protein
MWGYKLGHVWAASVDTDTPRQTRLGPDPLRRSMEGSAKRLPIDQESATPF